MANSVDQDQTAPIGAVCSGSTLFASILNSSVMLSSYLQLTTSADDIFRCIFFLGALRVKRNKELQIFVHVYIWNLKLFFFSICTIMYTLCVSNSIEFSRNVKKSRGSLKCCP